MQAGSVKGVPPLGLTGEYSMQLKTVLGEWFQLNKVDNQLVGFQ